MAKLSIDDLYSLETYAKLRAQFREQVLDHKRHRKLALGEHVTLLFEDRLTMHYQIQEMLRVERIFEEAAIREELEAYNPLIPDGRNWKATMLIEYADEDERREALARLVNIERRVWVQCADAERVFGIADEDLERSTEQKTSSVHFLRFELGAGTIAALKDGAALSAGIDHPEYTVEVTAPVELKESLIADLD
jgi:hypothetical protein